MRRRGTDTKLRARWLLIGAMAIVLGTAAKAKLPAAPVEPAESLPGSITEWLIDQQRFLRRYLAVLRQADHDYRYQYETPKLLMPIAMDLFAGYVVHLHEMEQRFVYPSVRNHPLTSDQQKILWLIEQDQLHESDTLKSWRKALDAYEEGGGTIEQVADAVDYLAQLVNRHLILQENRLFPLLDQIPPKEQAEVLKAIADYRRQVVGRDGAKRYEQLLTFIEEQIHAIAKRVW